MSEIVQASTEVVNYLFAWPHFMIPVLGTLIAMAVSFLPGVGSAAIMAFLLLVSLDWPVLDVFLLMGAVVGGATFMGSMSAILFNIPGSAPSAVALLDGYPLSSKGYPRLALSAAAISSATGSIVGVGLLLLFFPLIVPFLLKIGPLERLLVGVWGLISILLLPGGKFLQSLLLVVMGLLLSMVGSNPVTGEARWTFGQAYLLSGFNVITVLLGVFTLGQIIRWVGTPLGFGRRKPDRSTDAIQLGLAAVIKHRWLVLRSACLGYLVGIVPGIGGTVAGFLSYGAARSASDAPGRFGKGDLRGVVAPEAAIDAKDGGSILPAIAFGLPGSEAGVFLVSAMLIHGVAPGPAMLESQLPLTLALVCSLLLSNLLTSVLGLCCIPLLAKLRRINLQVLILPMLLLTFTAVLVSQGQRQEVWILAGFGALGYGLAKAGWNTVPLVVAFLLGEFLERNLVLTTRLVEVGRLKPFDSLPAYTLVVAILLTTVMGVKRMRKPGNNGDVYDEWLLLAAILAVALIMFITAAIGRYSPMTTGLAASAVIFAATLLLRNGLVITDQSTNSPGVGGSIQALSTRIRPFVGLFAFPLLVSVAGFAPGIGLAVGCWSLIDGAKGKASPLRAVALASGSFVLAMIASSWLGLGARLG